MRLAPIHDQLVYKCDRITPETQEYSTDEAGLLCSRCSLTSDEVKSLYKEGSQLEADESTNILTLPMSDAADLQEKCKDIWKSMAPSAKGCFTLYKWLTHLHTQ